MRRLFIIITLVLLIFEAKAQEPEVVADTLLQPISDSMVIQKKIAKKPHSPHKATLYALVPGWGQIYNGQWWKTPVIYGGFGGLIYGATWNIKQFKKYKSAFKDYTLYLDAKANNPDLPYPNNPSWDKVYVGGGVENFTPQQQSNFKTQLKNQKDNFRRNRDLVYIGIGALYALQIIDACVFAHFYDFEIDEDLTLNLQPVSFFDPSAGGVVGLTLTLNF